MTLSTQISATPVNPEIDPTPVAVTRVDDQVVDVKRPPFVMHPALHGPYAYKQQCVKCFVYYTKAYASLSSFNHCGGETCCNIDA